MIWQMMTAKLQSNGQLRTERDGDTEKGCQTSAVRLLMTMISPLCVGYNYDLQFDVERQQLNGRRMEMES